jgi:hypothetical protein
MQWAMRWHKRIRLDRDGIDLAAEVDAVIAINAGQPGSTTRVQRTSRVTVVQDARRAGDPHEPPQPDPKERR